MELISHDMRELRKSLIEMGRIIRPEIVGVGRIP